MPSAPSSAAAGRRSPAHHSTARPLLIVPPCSPRQLPRFFQGVRNDSLQGGIHPEFTGDTYLQILRACKEAAPDIHVHAFSPLEVAHGAESLGVPVRAFLQQLKAAGLGSLPGTAAEVLVDRVRGIICPDKLSSAQWVEVVGAAHEVGLRTTSTIMFGHVDSVRDWAEHLLVLRCAAVRSRHCSRVPGASGASLPPLSRCAVPHAWSCNSDEPGVQGLAKAHRRDH